VWNKFNLQLFKFKNIGNGIIGLFISRMTFFVAIISCVSSFSFLLIRVFMQHPKGLLILRFPEDLFGVRELKVVLSSAKLELSCFTNKNAGPF